MNDESGINLIKALNAVKVRPLPILEYRLHYDHAGKIYMCTMVDHPDNQEYLVVDKETYDNYFRYWVKDGRLEKVALGPDYMLKLTMSDHGYQVVKNHAGLILEDQETYHQTEYYAEPNS